MSYITFTTKAYTLNSLIAEVAAISTRTTIDTLVETLSPVAGFDSVKFEVINAFLEGNLYEVLEGNTFVAGSTPRTRLLNALRFRKTHGYFAN